MFFLNMDENKSKQIIKIRNWDNCPRSIHIFLYTWDFTFIRQSLTDALQCTYFIKKILFLVGMYLLVGFYESLMFFGRKIKGTIAFICGLVFIVVGIKFFGILFQVYGVYEFFKFAIITQILRFSIPRMDGKLAGHWICHQYGINNLEKITTGNITVTKKTDAQSLV